MAVDMSRKVCLHNGDRRLPDTTGHDEVDVYVAKAARGKLSLSLYIYIYTYN